MFGKKNKQQEESELIIALENREIKLAGRITDLIDEKNGLIDEVDELKVTNKRLKTTRVMEEESIAHKLRMREESCEINYEKKIQVNERACDDRVSKVKDEYRDKLEEQLVHRNDELKEMYTEILTRLPTIKIKTR